MSHNRNPDGLQSDFRKDTIWLLQVGMFLIHAAAAPFNLLWNRPGYLGRRSFGADYFVGLSFVYPLFGEGSRDAADVRMFMLSWQALWVIAVAQWFAAHALNRKLRIHSREIGAKPWIGQPGGLIGSVLVVLLARGVIEPVCHGLGSYLTYGPMAYVTSHAIVNWKMYRRAEEPLDAAIEGDDVMHRMGRM